MKVVVIHFGSYPKDYFYRIGQGVKLEAGHEYTIQTPEGNYGGKAVTVVGFKQVSKTEANNYKIITEAKEKESPRPDDKIERVVFDEAKRTTVVIWKDGEKTMIKCQAGDLFDKEKALALCYMKRILGNRGSFNETLKRYAN